MLQKLAIEINTPACAGCRLCEMVCSLEHTGMINPSLARIKVTFSKKDPLPIPIICRHCKNAPCKEACPIPEAMYFHEKTGAVMINEAKCIQCYACVDACPFGAIQVGTNKEVLKCDLCGGDPMCAKYCPEVVGYHYPNLPWPTQSCLQYIYPSEITKNRRLALAKKG